MKNNIKKFPTGENNMDPYNEISAATVKEVKRFINMLDDMEKEPMKYYEILSSVKDILEKIDKSSLPDLFYEGFSQLHLSLENYVKGFEQAIIEYKDTE